MIALIRDGVKIGNFRNFQQSVYVLRAIGLVGDYVEGDREIAIKHKSGKVFFHKKNSSISPDRRVEDLKQGRKIVLGSI